MKTIDRNSNDQILLVVRKSKSGKVQVSTKNSKILFCTSTRQILNSDPKRIPELARLHIMLAEARNAQYKTEISVDRHHLYNFISLATNKKQRSFLRKKFHKFVRMYQLLGGESTVIRSELYDRIVMLSGVKRMRVGGGTDDDGNFANQ